MNLRECLETWACVGLEAIPQRVRPNNCLSVAEQNFLFSSLLNCQKGHLSSSWFLTIKIQQLHINYNGKKLTIVTAAEDGEENKPLFVGGGNAEKYSNYEKQFGILLQS